MSQAINSDLFNLGSLTQDDKGRMKMSSKIDDFDLGNIITVLRDMQTKSIQPYKDKIDVSQSKIIPSIRDLEEKVKNIKNVLMSFTDSFKKNDHNVFKQSKIQIQTSDGSDSSLSLLANITDETVAHQSFNIKIEKLAKNANITSDSFLSDIDQPLNCPGTLLLNGAPIEIEYCDSILDVVDKINHTHDVSASLIRVGNQQFYLSLNGKEQGIPISYDDNGSGIISALCLPHDTNIPSNSDLDAQFTLNDIQLTSHSNNVHDIGIPGVSLHLLQANPDKTLTFDINQDNQAIVNQIHLFADVYNDLIDTLKNHNQYEIKDNVLKPKENAYLYGNSILRDVKELFDVLSSVQSFGSFRVLSDIGVNVNKFSNGKVNKHITIDDVALQNALEKDYEGVKKMLGTTYQASSSISIYSLPKNMNQGNFTINIDGNSAVFIDLDDLGNTTYLDVINGAVKGSGNLEGLFLSFSDQNAQNISFSFNKGIAERVKEKLEHALRRTDHEKEKTPFVLALEKLKEKDKINEKKIENIKRTFEFKIKNMESKMKKIYEVRVKTQMIKKSIQSFMGQDKK